MDGEIKNSKEFAKLKRFWNTLPLDPEIIKYEYTFDVLKAGVGADLPIIGSQFAYIFNYIPPITLYPITNNFKDFLGYDPQKFSLDFMYDIIHPDDLDEVIQFTKRHWDIANSAAAKYFQPMKYFFNLDYRLRKANKQYMRVVRSGCSVKQDKNGFTTHVLNVMTDITFLKKDTQISCFITGAEKQNLTLPHSPPIPKESEFSRREKEILKHIAEGKRSKEIAEELFISIHTVNTHRRNMLHKANADSTLSLVLFALDNGII